MENSTVLFIIVSLTALFVATGLSVNYLTKKLRNQTRADGEKDNFESHLVENSIVGILILLALIAVKKLLDKKQE